MWHRTLLTILIKCWHVAEAFLSYFGITTASRECCVFVLCFMLFIGSCASAVFDYACTALSSESSLNVAESFWSSVFTDWTCDGDWFVFRGQWVDNVGPDLSWTTNTASRRKEKKKQNSGASTSCINSSGHVLHHPHDHVLPGNHWERSFQLYHCEGQELHWLYQESHATHSGHSWKDHLCNTPLPERHIHHPPHTQSNHNCEWCKLTICSVSCPLVEGTGFSVFAPPDSPTALSTMLSGCWTLSPLHPQLLPPDW